MSETFEWYVEDPIADLETTLAYCLAKHSDLSAAATTTTTTTTSDGDSSSSTLPLRALHVGNGNSNFILDMQAKFNLARSVAVDVSEVATEEMRKVMAEDKDGKWRNISDRVTFDKCDLLASSLPYESESFELFVDKGAIDAMFCDNCEDSKLSFQALFNNLLDTASSTLHQYICVTLAEAHTVDLFATVVPSLFSLLDIFELPTPSGGSSSKLRPFAFVLSGGKDCVVGSSSADDDDNDKANTVIFHHSSGLVTPTSFSSLPTLLKSSRNAQSVATYAVVHFKPYDSETDLLDLASKIKSNFTSMDWKMLSWREEPKLLPIAFGMMKLELTLVIKDDAELEDMCEAIVEHFDLSSFDIQERMCAQIVS
jgi:translation elongation factor EF-1beta